MRRSSILRSLLLFGTLFGVLVSAPVPATAQEQRGFTLLGYYYDLDNDFDDWVGLRLQARDIKDEGFTTLFEGVVEQRGNSRGGIGQYFAYRDLGSRTYVFLTAGLGLGEQYFVRSKVYGELNVKLLANRNLVPVIGIGRNGYGGGWDLQTTLGATYYMHPFILQARWFRYARFSPNSTDNSIFLRADWLEIGPLDVGAQYLNGGEGIRIATGADEDVLRQFDTQVVTFDGTFWFRRGFGGLRLRLEHANRQDSYSRRGVEFGPIVNFE